MTDVPKAQNHTLVPSMVLGGDGDYARVKQVVTDDANVVARVTVHGHAVELRGERVIKDLHAYLGAVLETAPEGKL